MTLPNWDLSALYQNEQDPQINKDLNALSKKSQKFAEEYTGKLKNLTAVDLLKSIKAYEKISEGLGRLQTFAYLHFVTQMTNQEASGFYQSIAEQVNDIYTNLLFFSLELSKLSDAHLAKLLKDNKLKKYAPYIRDLRVSKPYQKSAAIEQVLHEKAQTSSSAWSRLFDETMAHLEFNYGSKKLSSAEIFDLLSSSNAATRKKAAQTIEKTLKENARIFAFITNTLAKDKAVEDKIRDYPHSLKARNISNLIEDEVVESLVSTVKENYKDLAHQYYKIKAKFFGVKKLNYWDRNAPLPGAKEQNISWANAKKIVLKAYKDFSPEMAEITELFFKNNWLDVPPKKGKDAGAFSHPATTDTHPFIMLNYQGKQRDVMTLAHELGHGVHQYLARKQGYLMADTPLTLAETASIFGEQLTFESLLTQAKTKEAKLELLTSKIEDSLNTIVRQIAFHEFEVAVHQERKKGEISIKRLGEIWYETQSASLGPNIKLTKDYQYFWSYIPHFIHAPFYVYAYAFGNCLVNSLYMTYKQGLPNFEQKYLSALSKGGTLHHKDLLAPFGLDATQPQFWQAGLELPKSYIKELSTL